MAGRQLPKPESAAGREAGRRQHLQQLGLAESEAAVVVVQSQERGVAGSQTKTC